MKKEGKEVKKRFKMREKKIKEGENERIIGTIILKNPIVPKCVGSKSVKRVKSWSGKPDTTTGFEVNLPLSGSKRLKALRIIVLSPCSSNQYFLSLRSRFVLG